MGATRQRRRTRREGIREGVTIVLASIAAFAAGATALSLVRSAEYQSTAVVSGAPAGQPLRSAELARRTLDAVGARGEDAAALLERLEAERRSGDEATFTVRTAEPEAARRLAAGYARAYADAASRAESDRARSGDGAAAAPPRAGPAGPARRDRETLRAAVIGAAAGLLAGLLLALAREALDVRRASSRSVGPRLGVKQLGWVPEAPRDPDEAAGPAPLEAPEGASAAAYAELAASVTREAELVSARVVLVCGTVDEDHAEQVAAGLGAALAAAGRRVAVVELDPARPSLRRQFALARGPGAAELARGEATLEQALAPVPGADELAVLPAGAGAGEESGSSSAVLEGLRDRFELVVVAGPPLLPGAADELPAADALLLAVDLRAIRRSRRTWLERRLAGLGMPVLGFVLLASPSGDAPLSARRA